MNKYKELRVWQEAMDMVEEVYKIVSAFPDSEKFALSNQLRRAAVSVPSNIAEGAGRNNPGEFKQFLGIAFASCCEVDTQLEIAIRLNYVKREDLVKQLDRLNKIMNMIFKLKRTVQK
ncbi:four helix bundle protein [Salibacteraceae bacterium]|nr:four helix bundle protein [Salibacteraceae bacterium]